MRYWLIPLILLSVVLIGTLVTALVCFLRIFYSPKRKESKDYPLPSGGSYDRHRPQIIRWIDEVRTVPHRDVSITSHDGLRLSGAYYECEKGAPIEILFHGYKGSREREISGGLSRCFSLGRNALMVDHRASGRSEGRVITFGAKESSDCLGWVDFVLREIDPNAKIILTGVSMGAATVLMASARPLPPNVIGILSDCGYSSTRAIVQKVMGDMGLPAKLLYPFARLGALLFGGFDPDGDSPLRAMKQCHLPVIFFHGDADGFVPHTMSVENYEACASERKRLVITSGADHGLCYPTDQAAYEAALREFFDPIL